MDETPLSKTQALLMLPTMVGEIKGRLDKVESESVETKIFMGKMDLHMDFQSKILEKIDKRMESGDSKFVSIEQRIGAMEALGATAKAAWMATWKGITIVFAVAGSIGGLITWVMTHVKLK